MKNLGKVTNPLDLVTKEYVDGVASKKVDSVAGKGLSTNDYTTEEKNKLASIDDNANNYTHPASHPSSMITGLGDAATKNVGTAAGTVASGDHKHKSADITDLNVGVTSVSLASGTNNGTVKLTVNGTATDNIAVKGLKSAAFTESSTYATQAQLTAIENILKTI